jgi:hypothetical protein
LIVGHELTVRLQSAHSSPYPATSDKPTRHQEANVCFAQPLGKSDAKFDLGCRTRHDRSAHFLKCLNELILSLKVCVAHFLLCFSDFE